MFGHIGRLPAKNCEVREFFAHTSKLPRQFVAEFADFFRSFADDEFHGLVNQLSFLFRKARTVTGDIKWDKLELLKTIEILSPHIARPTEVGFPTGVLMEQRLKVQDRNVRMVCVGDRNRPRALLLPSISLGAPVFNSSVVYLVAGF